MITQKNFELVFVNLFVNGNHDVIFFRRDESFITFRADSQQSEVDAFFERASNDTSTLDHLPNQSSPQNRLSLVKVRLDGDAVVIEDHHSDYAFVSSDSVDHFFDFERLSGDGKSCSDERQTKTLNSPSQRKEIS